jgi:putative FmdB family regulatory protein
MPIYVYKCKNCNRQFEVTQKFSDPPLVECSHCGGELRKLITNTSFILKGSGWYVTDYPSVERKKAMKEEESARKEGTKPKEETKSKKKEEAVGTK